jgi:hypothetical protein
MRTVVYSEVTPTILGVNHHTRSCDIWCDSSVETIIMTSGTIDDVPRSGWVVQLIWVSDTSSVGCWKNWGLALVEVLVTVKDDVDAVLIEEGFESALALRAGA